jgi:hypothetical protein
MVGAGLCGGARRALVGFGFSHCALLLASLGCGSQPSAEPRDVADATDTGRALPAHTRLEQALLRALPTLPSGQPRQIAGSTIVAEAPYTAASGRTCRPVSIQENGKSLARLACQRDGAWYFVPDVFGAAEAVESKR